MLIGPTGHSPSPGSSSAENAVLLPSPLLGRPASCSSRGRCPRSLPPVTVIPLSSKPHLQGSCTSVVPVTTLFYPAVSLDMARVFPGVRSEGPLIAAFLTVKMSIRYWWLSPSQSQHRQQTQSVELFVAHTGGMSQGDLLIDSQSSNMLLIASLVRTLPTAKLGLSN